MEYLLNARQTKEVDTFSIQLKKIPSLVLMERAALSVTERIISYTQDKKIESDKLKVLCVCGHGNNGADGIAVARQLNERDIKCDILTVGDENKRGTDEYELQLEIARNLDIQVRNNAVFDEYNVIVDAIFGIGLSRDIEGGYKQIIEEINAFKNDENVVVAVDIPSGVNASNGHIMNCAVKADITVTFGYNKVGIVLYPGADYAGNVYVSNIGFAKEAYKHTGVSARKITNQDVLELPQRDIHGNKGTFGKTFIIAGSENMGGAACMVALASYRSGSGLVKVFTHSNNRNLILSHVPEAIIECYNNENEHDALEYAQLAKDIESSIDWSSCVIIGPGLSTSKRAVQIVECVIDKIINTQSKPFIIDADALNIIASDENLKAKLRDYIKRTEIENKRTNVIITPHIGEMARLTKKTIDKIKSDPVDCAKEVSKEYGIICVLKDARTIVTDGDEVYINTSGNAGMATGGSGDVLTGVIAGLINDGGVSYSLVKAVAFGVYIHGKAGDFAKSIYGETSMKAMDIAEAIPQVFKDYR